MKFNSSIAEIDKATVSMVEALRECTPSYFNHEGDTSRLNARNSAYGGGALAFYKIIAEWRALETIPGLELTTRAEQYIPSAQSESGEAHIPFAQSDVAS